MDDSEVHSTPGGHGRLASQLLAVKLKYILLEAFLLYCSFSPTPHSCFHLLSKLGYLYANPCLRLYDLRSPIQRCLITRELPPTVSFDISKCILPADPSLPLRLLGIPWYTFNFFLLKSFCPFGRLFLDGI